MDVSTFTACVDILNELSNNNIYCFEQIDEYGWRMGNLYVLKDQLNPFLNSEFKEVRYKNPDLGNPQGVVIYHKEGTVIAAICIDSKLMSYAFDINNFVFDTSGYRAEQITEETGLVPFWVNGSTYVMMEGFTENVKFFQ